MISLPVMKDTFKITRETEGDGCWMFEVEWPERPDTEPEGPHRLRLSWEDYDMWVRGGSVEPEAVARAVLRYLESTGGLHELPGRIDSSHPRRIAPDADRRITALIEPVAPGA